MFMKQNKNTVTPEQANDALNELMIKGASSLGLTYEQAFEILSAADQRVMQELTGEYFNFEKEGTYHFIFEGMSLTNMADGKGGTRPVEIVKLRDKDGNILVNGNAVLVNSLKKVEQLPCYCRVIYKGDKKSGTNTYKDLQVFTLPLNS